MTEQEIKLLMQAIANVIKEYVGEKLSPLETQISAHDAKLAEVGAMITALEEVATKPDRSGNIG